MIDVRRLLAVGAGLLAAVALTCTHVWGDPKRDKGPDDLRGNGPVQPPGKEKERVPLDRRFSEDLARSRFAVPLAWADGAGAGEATPGPAGAPDASGAGVAIGPAAAGFLFA